MAATAKTYDSLNRLQAIATVGTGTVATYAYTYNALHQRTRADLADQSHWGYVYDTKGQLIDGKRYWSNNVPAGGEQFEYDFDSIGNRIGTRDGGDQNGSNLWSATYLANGLNQYTNRSVPAYVNLRGAAKTGATVTVNNSNVVRQGEYFFKAWPVSNALDAAYQSLSIVGVKNNAGTGGEDAVTVETGHYFVAQTPEPFVYDADGNLIQDGRWVYSWDGENRLVRMETRTNINATVPRIRLDFAYDFQGRRVRKTVYSSASNGVYLATNEAVFVYDGWNVIQERNISSGTSTTNSYLWGQDLSASLQGAGGIGGLISMSSGSNAYFYAYDGNGNVVGLLDAQNGVSVAEYEYSPFGETLRVIGPAATNNHYRFSTKCEDQESGLDYYGFRYYSPALGRWLNRDPMGEMGSRNLMAFVGNDPVNTIDRLGLESVVFVGKAPVTLPISIGYGLQKTFEVPYAVGISFGPKNDACGFAWKSVEWIDDVYPTSGDLTSSLKPEDLLIVKAYRQYDDVKKVLDLLSAIYGGGIKDIIESAVDVQFRGEFSGVRYNLDSLKGLRVGTPYHKKNDKGEDLLCTKVKAQFQATVSANANVTTTVGLTAGPSRDFVVDRGFAANQWYTTEEKEACVRCCGKEDSSGSGGELPK